MSKDITKNGRKIKIISADEQKTYISAKDAEMDRRAVQAVKAAIEKAEFCQKPVAKYDKIMKTPYLEYADGTKKYAKR